MNIYPILIFRVDNLLDSDTGLRADGECFVAHHKNFFHEAFNLKNGNRHQIYVIVIY